MRGYYLQQCWKCCEPYRIILWVANKNLKSFLLENALENVFTMVTVFSGLHVSTKLWTDSFGTQIYSRVFIHVINICEIHSYFTSQSLAMVLWDVRSLEGDSFPSNGYHKWKGNPKKITEFSLGVFIISLNSLGAYLLRGCVRKQNGIRGRNC